MGKAAAQLLLHMVHSGDPGDPGDPGKNIAFETVIVDRASLAAPPEFM
jgi:hypothetical protein